MMLRQDRIEPELDVDDIGDVGAENDEGRVGDVDDVEHAERDRHAGGHRSIEAADQDARHDGIDQKIERKDHSPALQRALKHSVVPGSADRARPA